MTACCRTTSRWPRCPHANSFWPKCACEPTVRICIKRLTRKLRSAPSLSPVTVRRLKRYIFMNRCLSFGLVYIYYFIVVKHSAPNGMSSCAPSSRVKVSATSHDANCHTKQKIPPNQNQPHHPILFPSRAPPSPSHPPFHLRLPAVQIDILTTRPEHQTAIAFVTACSICSQLTAAMSWSNLRTIRLPRTRTRVRTLMMWNGSSRLDRNSARCRRTFRSTVTSWRLVNWL